MWVDFAWNSVLQLIHLQNKERRLARARMMILNTLFRAMKLLSSLRPIVEFVARKV